MLNQIKDGNIVHIEGVLSEIDLKYGVMRRDTGEMKTISGEIKVRVDTEINHEEISLEIPVRMFAQQYTKSGKPNPVYEHVEKIMTEYTSIAASNIDVADRVRITRGEIRMQEYYNRNGALVSYPSVSASFVTKIPRDDCKPTAGFTLTFMILNKKPEVDKDGVETGRVVVNGLVPQWDGSAAVVPLIAANPGVVDAISNLWNDNDTVSAAGTLNFSSKSVTSENKVDFGTATVSTRTVSVSELLIDGGTAAFDGALAISEDDAREGLTKRKERLEKLKTQQTNSVKKVAPAQNSNKFNDLGF